MTMRTTTFLFFLVALIVGAWPLAIPITQAAPAQVNHVASAETPAA
jgi:hypothetical protein